MTAYYNEHDPKAAAWLRELIKAGHIAPGEVDERNIEDVRPDELIGFTQCHFFAGIGVWSYALRLAGWPDDRPAWTGSCPCQPFSAAGKKLGFTDERHLWPAWFHLIQHGKPGGVPIFGEQVASKDGLAWLDLVQTDLEGAGYACWPVDLCAAGVGAPHIRQRLFFVAERVGDTSSAGLSQRISNRRVQRETLGAREGQTIECASNAGGLADAESERRNRSQDTAEQAGRSRIETDGSISGTSPTNGYWRDPDWLYCRDGKWRPVRSGSFPLVDGAPARVGRLRGYGNAINAEVAKEFICASMQILTRRETTYGTEARGCARIPPMSDNDIREIFEANR